MIVVPAAGRPEKRSRRDEWRSAAALLRGTFVPGKKESNDEILVAHGPWTIRVHTFFVQVGNVPILYTRALAHFIGLRDLRVKVRRRNALDRFLGALGFGGRGRIHPVLLDGHVVKGKPASRLPSLFADEALAGSIDRLEKAELAVEPAARKLRRLHGEDVGAVWCRTTGLQRDADLLAGMVDAVASTLDALARVGEARRTPSPDGSETR